MHNVDDGLSTGPGDALPIPALHTFLDFSTAGHGNKQPAFIAT
jgi:hypothetical protein